MSDLQDTLERLMRDAQGWVMEVMKELVNVEAQLNLCKKRLEISDAYEELDHQYHLINPVPIRPCHAPLQFPLIEAPRIVRAVVLLPSRARDQSKCPSSTTRTRTTALPGPIGARE